MSQNTGYVIFFVLRGLLDGDPGEQALTCGDELPMKDGWYFMLIDNSSGEAPDGYGPYDSHDEAEEAAQDALL